VGDNTSKPQASSSLFHSTTKALKIRDQTTGKKRKIQALLLMVANYNCDDAEKVLVPNTETLALNLANT
jgi:hypothetical protein